MNVLQKKTLALGVVLLWSCVCIINLRFFLYVIKGVMYCIKLSENVNICFDRV